MSHNSSVSVGPEKKKKKFLHCRGLYTGLAAIFFSLSDAD